MGRVALGVVDGDVIDVEEGGRACGLARVIEIAGELGLAIDDDIAAGMGVEIDPELRVAIGDDRALMGKALAVHAVARACLPQQIGGAGFQNARTDAAQHIIAGLAFEDDGVDALTVQELAEQKPRGAAADDADLSAHVSPPRRTRQTVGKENDFCIAVSKMTCVTVFLSKVERK